MTDGEDAPGVGATVSLREITAENLRSILMLDVSEQQKGFVSPNAVSIAQAHYSPGAWFRAIYADDTPVGFVMNAENPDAPFYMLWRFMVDERYQGLGFARRALELVIDRVRALPGATELLLTHLPGEHGPEGFYKRVGFEHTGKKHGAELEMRIALSPPTRPTAPETTPIKLYFDYKSPYAFLAMQPAFDLPKRYRVSVRWIPYFLRIKGRGERSIYSEWKARYSYMDARRWANRRGGFPIKGPLKVYDSTASLIGGLYAQEHGFFRPYSEAVFSRFFKRELEIDLVEEIAGVIEELGHSGSDYLEWANGAGAERFEACVDEGRADHVFGVPIFVLDGESFWGHDRIPLLEERLTERGLCR